MASTPLPTVELFFMELSSLECRVGLVVDDEIECLVGGWSITIDKTELWLAFVRLGKRCVTKGGRGRFCAKLV